MRVMLLQSTFAADAAEKLYMLSKSHPVMGKGCEQTNLLAICCRLVWPEMIATVQRLSTGQCVCKAWQTHLATDIATLQRPHHLVMTLHLLHFLEAGLTLQSLGKVSVVLGAIGLFDVQVNTIQDSSAKGAVGTTSTKECIPDALGGTAAYTPAPSRTISNLSRYDPTDGCWNTMSTPQSRGLKLHPDQSTWVPKRHMMLGP